MRVLYLEWKSFCNEDMFQILRDMGHTVVRIPFAGISTKSEEIVRELEKRQKSEEETIVFSFNYFPNVSECCVQMGCKYVSWVYDSPYIHVYSYTVLNLCNYIFLFDYAVYEELHSAGIQTVYYMPLAVHEKRLAQLDNTESCRRRYQADISFTGSLYSDSRNRLYDRFRQMKPYVKGYLDGVIAAQLHSRGCYFLKDMLTEDIVEELQRIWPTDPNAKTVLSPEGIYADYVLARQITAIERNDLLQRLGSRLGKDRTICLYTNDKTVEIPGVINRGPVDYYDEMPFAFMNSKINLNITLRSIKTGIPLRVFDIMGCGGFVLSNYQEELASYFEIGSDLVCYGDEEDLLEKAEYYLAHDKERKEIAENGCRRVRTNHTLTARVQEILEIVNFANIRTQSVQGE